MEAEPGGLTYEFHKAGPPRPVANIATVGELRRSSRNVSQRSATQGLAQPTERDRSRSSASRMKRHRERRRQGTRCVAVDVSQGELDAFGTRTAAQRYARSRRAGRVHEADRLAELDVF